MQRICCAIGIFEFSHRYPTDGKLGVYRTRDQGESWQRLSRGLPEDCYSNVLRRSLAVDRLETMSDMLKVSR